MQAILLPPICPAGGWWQNTLHPDGHMQVPPRGAEKAGKCTSDKQDRLFAGSDKVSAFVTDLLNEYYVLTKKMRHR